MQLNVESLLFVYVDMRAIFCRILVSETKKTKTSGITERYALSLERNLKSMV